MNIPVTAIETIVLIILFTAAVLATSKNPLDTVYDLPEPIVNRCLELGLIDETKKATSIQTKLKKLAAAAVIAIILAVIFYLLNGARTFWQGAFTSYIIWLIIDWYDCFVLDWGWVCHSKKIIIPGTEDLMDSYKDYKFHAIGSLKGMVIGLPVCLVVGLLVKVISLIF